ncbi:Hypothetical Protein FCC1311_003972 [Hondaea fermentalgiana]|uniref:Uncharacterized protein n=1 Tax=Hondaea fermentalgiana TaxID=2315210 RepID=A0A2R5G1J9_9STRA|nr:Hypothetical Protein FCC1311_003972 [Hondaea fermentalgiana]|eukprot:GBG24179.1 Hypothetical Protein FCC1311_003972 [Hondaea fermentalgiana]
MEDSKWYDENKWLIATLGAALCWSAADILCDMCIGEDDDEEEHGFEMVPLSDKMVNKSSAENLRALANESSPTHKLKNRSSSQTLEKQGEASLRMRNGENNAAAGNRSRIDARNGTSSMETGRLGDGNVSSDALEVRSRRARSSSFDGNNDVSTTNNGIGGTIANGGPADLSADVRKLGSKSEDLEGNENSLHRDDSSVGSDDEEEHLDGVQDCAVAGITTGSIMYMLSLKRVHLSRHAIHAAAAAATLEKDSASLQGNSQPQFIWSPGDDLEWWLATLSGILMFSHYFFLLKAYDNAPSTVINPLIQVSSTWMLVGSAVPAALTGSTFIRPFDLFCYFVIVLGGILPSLDGDFKRMLRWKFWKQSYVRNVVVSEFAVGIYDLVMSYSLKSSAKKEKFRGILPADLEFEFFFIAWCGFAVVFCIVYALVPSLRQRFIDLQNIPRKIIFFSGFGQLLTLFGYYLSQFAYSWYYQASIVHAAEASLSQGLNLLFALGALKLLGVGRESAVSNLRIKILSCLIVSVGLFMLTMGEDDSDEALPSIHTDETSGALALVSNEQHLSNFEGFKSAANNIIGTAGVADIVTAAVAPNRPRMRKTNRHHKLPTGGV